MTRRFPLDLDTDDAPRDQPTFLRIARAITREILRGRLAPGARLPGTRPLAAQLGVHRNTVSAAYDELTAEGWLVAGERRGTFVSEELPIQRLGAGRARVGRSEGPRARGFELPEAPARRRPELPAPPAHAQVRGRALPAMLMMAGGVPDLRELPTAALARAYRRALARNGASLLDYGDARGHPALRAELARMLSEERALAVGPEDIMVTHGAQEALYLVGQVLCARGDRVAVESLGYRPAWEALERNATLVSVPVDDDGVDVEALARLVRQRRIRALYVTPHHQYPSMATLSAGRRLALLELAARERLALIEDDYDHEIHYEGRPVAPLASADRAGVVVYVGTLSKVLAPGLRLGFLVAPAALLARALELRRGVVRQGDLVLQQAVAELFADGEVQRHARRMRRRYAVRRACVAHELERRLRGAVEVRLPAGGMALWLRVAPDIDPEVWAARALERGVAVAPGRFYTFDGAPTPHLRVGYGCLDERELVEAVARLARALPARAARPAQRRA